MVYFLLQKNLNDNNLSEQTLFHFNDFTGAMTKEICDLAIHYNLMKLYSDCLDIYHQPPTISCACFTDCCDKIEYICNSV